MVESRKQRDKNAQRVKHTWCHAVTFRTVFRRFQCIAFRSDGFPHVIIIISVLQEATELLVNTRFLRICHCKVVILANKPVAQATELNSYKQMKSQEIV